MKPSILFALPLLAVFSCTKKQNTTPVNPYSKTDVYAGRLISAKNVEGCGSISRALKDTFFVSYVASQPVLVVSGFGYLISNPCNNDSSYGSMSFYQSSTINATNSYPIVSSASVSQNVTFSNDSIFITYTDAHASNSISWSFAGKRL